MMPVDITQIEQPSIASNCTLCGDTCPLSLGAACHNLRLLNTWRGIWATSLCTLLQVEPSYEHVFLQGQFCSTCQEIVCQGEFMLNSLSNLQSGLDQVKDRIKHLLSNNPTVKFNNDGDETNDGIKSILKRFNTNTILPSPSAYRFRSKSTSSEKLFSSPLLPNPDSSRLQKLKDRQIQLRRSSEDAVSSPLTRRRTSHSKFTLHYKGIRQKRARIRQGLVTQSSVPSTFHDSNSVCLDYIEKDAATVDNPNGSVHEFDVKEEEEEFGANDDDYLQTDRNDVYELPEITEGDDLPDQAEVKQENFDDENMDSAEITDSLRDDFGHSEVEIEDGSRNAGEIEEESGSSKLEVPRKSRIGYYPSWTPKVRILRFICNHPDCLTKDLSWPRPRLVRSHCLTEHPNEGLEETPYHCSNCESRFITSQDLQRHNEESHADPTEPNQKCSECNKKFKYAKLLNKHQQLCVKNAHQGTSSGPTVPTSTVVKFPPCTICGKTFHTVEEFDAHPLLHLFRDPKVCVVCPALDPKVFQTTALLKNHVNIFHNHLRPRKPPKERRRNTRTKKPLYLRRQKILNLFKARGSNWKARPREIISCTFSKCQKEDLVFATRLYLKRHLMSTHGMSKFDVVAFIPPFPDKMAPGLNSNCGTENDLDWGPVNGGAVSKSGATEEESAGFLCPQCGVILKTKGGLATHVRFVHMEMESNKCSICSKTFQEGTPEERKKGVAEHELLHESSTPFRCVFCDKNSRSTAELQEHVRSSHENFQWKCTKDDCDKAFQIEAQLKEHLRYHDRHDPDRAKGSKPPHKVHKCPSCTHVTHTAKLLKLHIVGMHTSERPFPCDVEGCTRSFVTPSRLRAHLRVSHRIGTSIRMYPCRICGKEFARASGLTKHEQCHNTERPYICEICPATFKTSNHLHQHKKVHDPNKKTGNNWKLQQPRKPRLKDSILEGIQTPSETLHPSKKNKTGNRPGRSKNTKIPSTTSDGPNSSADGNKDEPLPVPPPAPAPSMPSLQEFALSSPNPVPFMEMQTVDPRYLYQYPDYTNPLSVIS